MRFASQIDLLVLDGNVDSDGFRKPNILSRKSIFAKKSDIKTNEFYAASKAGYSLKVMFEIYTFEYESQKHLEYKGIIYEIIRSYEKGKYTEIVCQAYSGNP